MLAVCTRFWLLSLTVRRSFRTVFIGIKLEVRCTSVASFVSLFIGIEKKMWPVTVSHFRDRVDRQPTQLLTLSALRPLRASGRNLTNY